MQKSMNGSKRTASYGAVRVHSEIVGTEDLSKSVPTLERSRLESPSKSNWQVFMFGVGTGKYPTKMELSDIKKRQIRQQATEDLPEEGVDESDRRRSGKKRWWLLIDVFRCGGGYEGEVAVKDLQTSFQTLKRFD